MKRFLYALIAMLIIPGFLICVAVLQNREVSMEGVIDDSSIVGKVIAGYQGWHLAYGDGSPVNRWVHWSTYGQKNSNVGMPTPGNVHFDLYPDTKEYGKLYDTGLGNLGDGRPAQLYSAYDQEVIDLHFSWMQQYGIDGVALQRFGTALNDLDMKAVKDTITVNVMDAAENYGRTFYIMYDITGMDAENFVDKIKNDWSQTMVAQLEVTSSSQYAKHDGKPVVAIWGMGFHNRAFTPSECISLIDWFKNQGIYVIGGVPKDWRTGTGDSEPGFQEVYESFNMISPWTVGRYKDVTKADNYKTNSLIPDRDYLATLGIDYQPVVYPGFSHSNWNTGEPNMIPRDKGLFFWRQVFNIRDAGIPSMYIAMFDEYDEGTAIAKAAEDSSMIPAGSDQYYLTLSSDGTYISSDFYLRLAGSATRMIKGIDPISSVIPIPYSEGPVFFRTGLENVDAQLQWSDTTIFPAENITGYSGNPSGPILGKVKGEISHRGEYSIRVSGHDNDTVKSNIYWKILDVNIPVSEDTKISYWFYPTNALSRYLAVDLVMSDGSTLRDSGAMDQNGISMHPKSGRGVTQKWTQIHSNIGQWLAGKTIDTILIGYDHDPDEGDFKAYFDDIVITNGSIDY